MKRVATIILNRNLPNETDQLWKQVDDNNHETTDIYVVEAGSDSNNLSTHTTWHVNDPESLRQGLRYSRGMNFALSELWKDNKFKNYEAFFLITNDTEFQTPHPIQDLLDVLDKHPKVGIVSPCSDQWGENILLQEQRVKYFWFVHNTAYMMRRNFLESIVNTQSPDMYRFIFDGTNFRGYGMESEMIAKAYANDWAVAITSDVQIRENESYLLNRSDFIKTEPYDENLKLYVEEGKKWMRDKYGFNSHWSMNLYAKLFYDQFFEYNPDLIGWRL
jgi:hypothetical protein